jgi:hypothetical protein
MIDPLFGLAASALFLLANPAVPSLDPGPDAACPDDTRRVRGSHADEMLHLCTDLHDGHCFAYDEGFSEQLGMRVDVDVCMDRFEAPNERGVEPYVMRSFRDAERWCKARSKRVCSEEEWELACEGDEHRPWAYGWKVETSLCNSDKQWRAFDQAKLGGGDETRKDEVERLWQGAPSGRYLTCVSPYGVYDLTGNVEEWVRSRKGRKFEGALMGGFWAKPWTGCRGTNDAHEERFQFYETGFRCCSSPKKS